MYRGNPFKNSSRGVRACACVGEGGRRFFASQSLIPDGGVPDVQLLVDDSLQIPEVCGDYERLQLDCRDSLP